MRLAVEQKTLLAGQSVDGVAIEMAKRNVADFMTEGEADALLAAQRIVIEYHRPFPQHGERIARTVGFNDFRQRQLELIGGFGIGADAPAACMSKRMRIDGQRAHILCQKELRGCADDCLTARKGRLHSAVSHHLRASGAQGG